MIPIRETLANNHKLHSLKKIDNFNVYGIVRQHEIPLLHSISLLLSDFSAKKHLSVEGKISSISELKPSKYFDT